MKSPLPSLTTPAVRATAGALLLSSSLAFSQTIENSVQVGGTVTSTQDAALSASNARFGATASVDGDRLAVSAPARLHPMATGPSHTTGTVFIFDRDSNGNWVETAEINRDEFGTEDRQSLFGQYLILRGDRLVVGPYNSNVVYIYERSAAGDWLLEATLNALQLVDPSAISLFGVSMSLQGDTLVVGASAERTDPNQPTVPQGRVYVFDKDTASGEWALTTTLDRDFFGGFIQGFGATVVLEDNTIFVGAPVAQTGNGTGRLFAYTKSASGDWLPDQEIQHPGSAELNRFGTTIAVGGGFLSTNGTRDDSSFPQLRMYEQIDGLWVESPQSQFRNSIQTDVFQNDRTMIIVRPSGEYDFMHLDPSNVWRDLGEVVGIDQGRQQLDSGELGDDGRYVIASNSPQRVEVFDLNLLDTDADGALDLYDNCPTVPNPMQTNTDALPIFATLPDGTQVGQYYLPNRLNDELGDLCDDDDDGDGFVDAIDAFPLDYFVHLDTDGDTIGDAIDTDDDGDGIEDTLDNCPVDVNADQLDVDDDELGDACDAVDNRPDTDSDGFVDVEDNCPALSNPSQLNTDGDFEGNACDLDDDNDTTPDLNDAFPLDPGESVDTDGDMVGNNFDTDDDNDGFTDLEEIACAANPLDNSSVCQIDEEPIDENVEEEQGNIDTSTPVNLNSWGSGFNASFEYIVTPEDTLGGTLGEWRIDAETSGDFQITSAWLNSGYNGGLQIGAQSDAFVITNEGQSYIPTVVAGDVLRFTIQGTGSDFDNGGVTLNFVSLNPTALATGSCDDPVPVSLPFMFTGQGEFCWVASGNVSYVNSWNTEAVDINGIDLANQWSNSLPASPNGEFIIRYNSNVDWGHFEIIGN